MSAYAGYKPAHEVFVGKLTEVNWETKTYVAVAIADFRDNSVLELLDEDLNVLKSFTVSGTLLSCAASSKGDVMGVGLGPLLGHSQFLWKPFSEYYVWGSYDYYVRNAFICLNGGTQAVQLFGDTQSYRAVAADRDGNFTAGYFYGGAAFLWYPWWVATIPNEFIYYWLIGWHQQVDRFSPKGGRLWSTPAPYGNLPGIYGDMPNNRDYRWTSSACDGEGSTYFGSSQGVIKFNSAGGIVWERRIPNSSVSSSMCTDNQNNVYFGFTPISWTPSPFGPRLNVLTPRVIKLSKTGATMWSREVTGSYTNTPYVAVDGQRSTYICDGYTLVKTPAPVSPGAKKPEKPITAWSAGINVAGDGGTVSGAGAHKTSVFVSTKGYIGTSSRVGNVTKYDRDTGKVVGSKNYSEHVIGIGVTQAFGPRVPPRPGTPA